MMHLDDAKLREDVFALQLWLDRRYRKDFNFLFLECYGYEIINVACIATAPTAQSDAERILAALGWKLNLHEGPTVVDMITADGAVLEDEKFEMIERIENAYVSTLSAHEIIKYWASKL